MPKTILTVFKHGVYVLLLLITRGYRRRSTQTMGDRLQRNNKMCHFLHFWRPVTLTVDLLN